MFASKVTAVPSGAGDATEGASVTAPAEAVTNNAEIMRPVNFIYTFLSV